ncbi:hypothetical protein [Paeniglutamicibacter cryotolerans]|uniref:Uncharacterized protein n=1 Tax=Paeniglutamicibacter cryotolerans TaxID=670079 RepID=A0A839QPD0_9MICC|nr:hypothetical protein [Paeniglutamicibacter cryotolerans]MBB2997463.1 hypothetical protein [Paeniglutamicibacter cryotolerans]
MDPSKRSKPIARLRIEAMTRGAAPVRTCDLSSKYVTSRVQCNEFSMAQCPRTQVFSCRGLPR